MTKYLIIYLAIMNIITFLIYGVDKIKAKYHRYRISEFNLILLALIGGSIGAILGMFLFNHKTNKAKFLISIPLILCLHLGIMIYIVTIRGGL